MCFCQRLTFSYFLFVAGSKNDSDKNAQSALDAPRSADKVAAEADDERDADGQEEDAAVHAVRDARQQPPGSRSPTPPPHTDKQKDGTIADHLAALVAKGARIHTIIFSSFTRFFSSFTFSPVSQDFSPVSQLFSPVSV